jgi:hypothetical protein
MANQTVTLSINTSRHLTWEILDAANGNITPLCSVLTVDSSSPSTVQVKNLAMIGGVNLR